MNSFVAIAGLAGGLAVFIYGVKMCSEGLQKLAARRLKQLVQAVTNSPILGLLAGALVTFAFQSSSATSALVVGFISAEVMTLAQALGVLLGSAIGSSLTAQLIAFRVTEFALVLLFIGVVLNLFSKRSRRRSLGQAFLGLGLIFYGMYMMSSAMAPIRDYPIVTETLVRLEAYPILEVLAAMVITAIIQSSSAFLALMMSLAAQGLVGAHAIIPFVLGAHLGGTVTGVISSLGAPGLDAKRAALANFGYKLANALVFLPLYRPLTELILWSSPNLGRQIANAHTFFSVAMAVGFLPLSAYIARIMERLVPDTLSQPKEAHYLDESLIEVPEVAVDQTHRQTLEMSRIVLDSMLEPVLPALRCKNDELIEQITNTEQTIDALYKRISQYIAKLGDAGMSDELMQRSIQILYAANDLEHIGDILTSVAQILRKVCFEELELSEEGLEEIAMLYEQISSNFSRAVRSFETSDSNLASQAIKTHPRILRLDQQLRYSHFDRMHSGNNRTRSTSSVHLDLIEALVRIDTHTMSIAQGVMGIV